MTKPNKHTLFSVLLLGFLLLNGCSSTSDTATTNPATNPEVPVSPTTTAPEGQVTATEKVKFKQEGGDERFTLKYKSDGAKLEAASGDEIARLKVDPDNKVKIKDAKDTVLGFVVPTTGAWKIENAEQSEELYILRQQDDGDYKLETGKDEPVYRIKARDYGYEIESPDKASLYKIKNKKGKVSLRNADDQTVLYTKDNIDPIAIAPFGFDVLSQEQQAALAYAVSQQTP